MGGFFLDKTAYRLYNGTKSCREIHPYHPLRLRVGGFFWGISLYSHRGTPKGVVF